MSTLSQRQTILYSQLSLQFYSSSVSVEVVADFVAVLCYALLLLPHSHICIFMTSYIQHIYTYICIDHLLEERIQPETELKGVGRRTYAHSKCHAINYLCCVLLKLCS